MNSATPIGPARRATILFANFFLIILAYYQVKAASRAVYIEYLGADNLPYVWIASAVFLGMLVVYYHRLVERHSRRDIVLSTTAAVIGLLILFRYLIGSESGVVAFAFYIFVDIFSVVLVEQLWSLANTTNTSEDGRRWYWLIGNGGLIGGLVGGRTATLLIERTPIHTQDLLLVAAGILCVLFVFNMFMSRLGLYDEAPVGQSPVSPAGDWRVLAKNRYLLLIAATLLMAQLVQPIVEYQYANTLAANTDGLDPIAARFGDLFTLIGLVGIAVNLTLTPLIHRGLGAIPGLLVQPFVVLLSSLVFASQGKANLSLATGMRVSDRGLNYSINRASKEILYIPIDPVHTYQAKAWIDMFGYRALKIFASLLILTLTKWLPFTVSLVQFSWFTVTFCIIWMLVIAKLGQEYRSVSAGPLTTPQAA